MRTLTARCPTRIDLAGGTLDIWPLNMLVTGALTVNVAIDLWASAEVKDLAAGALAGPTARAEIRSEDQGVEEVWASAGSAPGETKLPLLAACARYMCAPYGDPEQGFALTTRCASPAGAGLGGSSSLAIAVLGALQSFLGRPVMPPDEMVLVARDLEALVLGIPTGTQDHIAATYGGAAAIRYGAGLSVREPLQVDLERLGSRLVVSYAGASRLSASTNWDMMKRAIEGGGGEGTARACLQSIASIAGEMRAALIEGDLDAAGALLGREWEVRQKLSPKVSTALIEKALAAARAGGALAGKVCGAGGGGCVVFVCKEGARGGVEKALAALSSEGIRLLPASPTRSGLQLAA